MLAGSTVENGLSVSLAAHMLAGSDVENGLSSPLQLACFVTVISAALRVPRIWR